MKPRKRIDPSTGPCGILNVTTASSEYSPFGICSSEVFDPVQAWGLYAIVLEVFKDTLVVDHIKSFAEVHDSYVILLPLCHSLQ